MVTTSYDPVELRGALDGFLKKKGREVDSGLVSEVVSTTVVVFEEAIGVDAEEVEPYSSLMDDLELESIDFLDITFRMEKAFGINILSGRLFANEVSSDFDAVGLYEDPTRFGSKYTPDGLARLKELHWRAFETMSASYRKRLENSREQEDLVRGQNVLSLMVGVYDLCIEQAEGREERRIPPRFV